MYSVSDRETAVSDLTATSSSVFGPASSSVSHSSAAAPPRSRPNTGPASGGGGALAAGVGVGVALSALSSSQSNSSISATADAPMSAGPSVVLPGRAGGTVFRYPAARLLTNPTASMSISSCDSQQPLLSQSGSMASACSSRPSSDGMGAAAAGEYTKIDMDRTTALNMSIRELQERQERHCRHVRGVGGMGGTHGGGPGGSVWPKHPAVAAAGLTLMSLSCSSSFQTGSSPAPPHAAGPVGMSASLHSACLPSNCKCASAVPVTGALSSSCHAAHAPTGASVSASASGAADAAAGATLRAVDHAAKESARSGSIADLLARRSRHNSTAS